MNENLISLPSGMIINLANVAFFTAVGKVHGKIRVSFAATYTVRDSGKPMSVELDETDSSALLWELSRREVDISALIEKTGLKMIDLNVLNKGPAGSE